jgi:hypothetical protein
MLELITNESEGTAQEVSQSLDELAREGARRMIVIYRAIMVQALSPKRGQSFSPNLVHRVSAKVVHSGLRDS